MFGMFCMWIGGFLIGFGVGVHFALRGRADD